MDMKKLNENRFDEKSLLAKTDNNLNMKHFCLENMGLNLIKSQEYENLYQIIFSEINDFRFLNNIKINPSIYNTELTNIFLNTVDNLTKGYISNQNNKDLITIEFRLKENDSYYIYPFLPNIDEEGFKFCSTFYALNFNDYVYEEKFLFFELIYDDDSLVEKKLKKKELITLV